MKVRCIEDYEYKEYLPSMYTAIKNRVYKTACNGTSRVVVDDFGRIIMTFSHCCFEDYFEIIEDETPAEYLPFSEKEKKTNVDIDFINDKLNTIGSLVEKKNNDYGNSYKTTRDKYTHLSYLIRLEDKINRYKQLMKQERQVEDEDIIDTLADIIGYTILEMEYLKGDDE